MRLLLYLIVICTFIGCDSKKNSVVSNPSAPGFDNTNSDLEAIAIADKVMNAMGGRQNYDNTRYVKFTFKDERDHIWDKHTGDIRIEYLDEDMIILMNVHSLIGTAITGDTIIDSNHPRYPSLMNQGKEHWINDTYWLVMPFKLKDSGVTLKYVGEDKTQKGEDADVLSLTFKNVGVTPQNKYLVFVDQKDHLVVEWVFYNNATDTQPLFRTPWEDYQEYGSIKLSGGRGGQGLSNIAVLESIPEGTLSRI